MGGMTWFMTAGTAEFPSVTGEFPRAEAARNSATPRWRTASWLSFEPPATLHP